MTKELCTLNYSSETGEFSYPCLGTLLTTNLNSKGTYEDCRFRGVSTFVFLVPKYGHFTEGSRKYGRWGEMGI